MEKEKISRFDLEAAFKALDELEIPKVKGIRPNRMDLREAVVRADRTSALIEDYYDLNDPEDVQEASDDREAEIAKAKLARIEKIVDLNAESEDQIQPSYVGKTIIQCPQCMTLFYKDPADIEPSEDDPSVVNVSEICQHCGNDSGYTLIGKVAEETPEEASEEKATEEKPSETEEASEEETTEEETSEKEPAEEDSSEEESSEEDFELPAIEIPEEEEEKKESFNRTGKQTLTEDLEPSWNIVYFDGNEETITGYDAFYDKVDEAEAGADIKGIWPVSDDSLPSWTEEEGLLGDNYYESLNNSKLKKDSTKKSKLATKNRSKNLTLKEAINATNTISDLLAKAGVTDVEYFANDNFDDDNVIGDIYIGFNDKASLDKAILDVQKLVKNIPDNLTYQIWNLPWELENLDPDSWYEDVIDYCASINDVDYPDDIKDLTDEDIQNMILDDEEDIWVTFSLYDSSINETNESLNEGIFGAKAPTLKAPANAPYTPQELFNALKKRYKLKDFEIELAGNSGYDIHFDTPKMHYQTGVRFKTEKTLDKAVAFRTKECRESLNNSKLKKDSAKKSELATENTSKNLTLNENVSSPDDIKTEWDAFEYYIYNWADCEVDTSDLEDAFEAGLTGKKLGTYFERAYSGDELDYVESMYDLGKDIRKNGLTSAIQDIKDNFVESLTEGIFGAKVPKLEAPANAPYTPQELFNALKKKYKLKDFEIELAGNSGYDMYLTTSKMNYQVGVRFKTENTLSKALAFIDKEIKNLGESLTERVSTYTKRPVFTFKVYGTDNNANILVETEGTFKVDEVKKIKVAMQQVMDENPEVEHVFAEKITPDGKEIPLDNLTISRRSIDDYALEDEDVVDEGLGSAVANVVDGVANGVKSLLASDEGEKATLDEANSLDNLAVSQATINKLFNSFKNVNVSDSQTQRDLQTLKNSSVTTESLEFDEASFNTAANKLLQESGKKFKAKTCTFTTNGRHILIEGLIKDTNKKIYKTTLNFSFNPAKKTFTCINENFKTKRSLKIKIADNTVITESFK